MCHAIIWCCFFFQAEDGIRDLVRSRGLGDVYKRQINAEYGGVAREMPGLRVTLKDTKGKGFVAVLRPPADDYLHQLLTLARTKLRLTKPSRLYDAHSNELSPAEVQALPNGAVVIASVGPLPNRTRSPEALCSHLPECWRRLLGEHMLEPCPGDPPVSEVGTHMWLSVDASGLYFRVPQEQWAAVEGMLASTDGHFLHHVYHCRPRRLQLDLDGSPVPIEELASMLSASLHEKGHDASCAVAESPGKAECEYWGHVTFPHIICANDEEHDCMKRECAKILEAAIPARDQQDARLWARVVDRAHSAGLRCLGSDKWDGQKHRADERPSRAVVCLDSDGVALGEIEMSWYCPLVPISDEHEAQRLSLIHI
eukprot:TRINITY_DN26984_c0_g1_i1.p1 TRINITY_DN26984_c0_g1~~TRINITY_DN26984_c0_g1_i1.p1  ORF type:complete len:369 (-),score=53.85 TRINITY_DN26984_c0_g1_i1:104-1210(-)